MRGLPSVFLCFVFRLVLLFHLTHTHARPRVDPPHARTPQNTGLLLRPGQAGVRASQGQLQPPKGARVCAHRRGHGGARGRRGGCGQAVNKVDWVSIGGMALRNLLLPFSPGMEIARGDARLEEGAAGEEACAVPRPPPVCVCECASPGREAAGATGSCVCPPRNTHSRSRKGRNAKF